MNNGNRFGRVPFESITRHNVIEWLAWSSYSLPLSSVPLNSPSMQMLEDSLELVEARCGWSFPDLATTYEDPVGWWEWLKSISWEGKDKVTLMRLTIDTVNLWPRPFFMYWGPGCFNWYLEKRVYASYGMKVVSVIRGERGGPVVDVRIGRSIEKERWSRCVSFHNDTSEPDANPESSQGTSFAYQKGGVRIAEGPARIQSFTCMALGSDW